MEDKTLKNAAQELPDAEPELSDAELEEVTGGKHVARTVFTCQDCGKKHYFRPRCIRMKTCTACGSKRLVEGSTIIINV